MVEVGMVTSCSYTNSRRLASASAQIVDPSRLNERFPQTVVVYSYTFPHLAKPFPGLETLLLTRREEEVVMDLGFSPLCF